jgi:hypothetical protein
MPKTAAPSQTPALLAGMLCAIVLILIVAFRVLIQATRCPASTFRYDSMGGTTSLIFGLLIAMVSISFLMVNGIVLRPKLTTTSGRPAGRRHRLLFPLVGLCGFLASCPLLAMSVESYYCLTSTTVLLHPSLFGSPRLLSWNDVRTVEATCLRAGKYGPYGALQLILSEGTTLTVSLTSQLALDKNKYDAARAALASKSYRYHVFYTVTPAECSPSVYHLLLDWQK